MSDTIDTEEFLAHFGIKGMKWGVTHVVGSSGRVTGARSTSKGDPSHDYTEAQVIKSKHMSEMSNAELRTLTNRMNLEQSYSRLNPSRIQQGKKVAVGVIAGLTTYATLYKMFEKPTSPARQTFRFGKKIVQSMFKVSSKV